MLVYTRVLLAMVEVSLPIALSQTVHPVPRIDVDDSAALTRHFLARKPVVLQYTADSEVVAHWQIKTLAARFPTEKAVVMTVPKDWRDSRATNQLHIDPKHIDAMREVRMPFADYAELLARSDRDKADHVQLAPEAAVGRRHRRRQPEVTGSDSSTSSGLNWAKQHVYVRHKMPSDHRGDSLGPSLHALLAADFPSAESFESDGSKRTSTYPRSAGELKGVATIDVDGSLAVHDTKIRSGSAGLYYPAHSDCYHNILLVMQGRRRVRLMDQSAVWRRSSAAPRSISNFRALLRLKSLDNASIATTWAKMMRGNESMDPIADQASNTAATGLPVWETVLGSGEALYIPPTWLHDIYYIDSGMGINQFYDSPKKPMVGPKPVLNGVQAEVQLCKYLKARLDETNQESTATRVRSVERELGAEVGQMLKEVDGLIAQHRTRTVDSGGPQRTTSLEEL